MINQDFITAIDLGTSKVSTLIATKSKKKYLEVVGFGHSKSNGIKKGSIENVSLAVDSIKDSFSQAIDMAKGYSDSVYISISGAQIGFENREDYFSQVGSHGVITYEEVMSIPQEVNLKARNEFREIIHSFPFRYKIDGHGGIVDPVGMHAQGIEVSTHLVTSNLEQTNFIREALGGAGLSVEKFIFQPLADYYSSSNIKQQKVNSVMINIGEGTTDIAVFNRGSMVYLSVIPVGGFQFTNDIALTYNMSYEDAENLKLRYGHTSPGSIDIHEEIAINVIGSNTPINIRRRDLAQLMRERALELIRLIDIKLRHAGIKEDPNTVVNITGSASDLSGFFEMIDQYIPNSIIQKNSINSKILFPESLQVDQFTTALGLLTYGNNDLNQNLHFADIKNKQFRSDSSKNKIFEKIKTTLKI
ncbi:MAG: cell division protein FtsA [Dehalococcoidia bacterium]